ncbi:MAG: hypothetical protein EP330_19420 [Deltaproteobacteria bacterium]|nr:MAG: hypothetical protein EP330_19420 [Deltaproteobacteria bacterium]
MSRYLPLIALLVACNGGAKTPPDAAGDETTAPPGENHREPEATEGNTEEGEAKPEEAPFDRDAFGDPYFLAAEPAPTVENNVFKAVARHGGGCAEHQFTIELGGIGKSLPPTAMASLKHNGNGDACRALLIAPIEIDLNEAFAGKGCIGRLSLGTPPVTDPQAVGGPLSFDLDPIGCDEKAAPAE